MCHQRQECASLSTGLYQLIRTSLRWPVAAVILPRLDASAALAASDAHHSPSRQWVGETALNIPPQLQLNSKGNTATSHLLQKRLHPSDLTTETANMIRYYDSPDVEEPSAGGSGHTTARESQLNYAVCVGVTSARCKLTSGRSMCSAYACTEYAACHVELERFLGNHNFRFDCIFGEDGSNASVYNYTARLADPSLL